MPGTIPEPFAGWFAARGWRPRPHQLAVIDAAQAGESALLIAPTGGGKTLAGFLPSLIELAAAPRQGLHTLYVSPLKALATDVARNLLAPVAEMGLPVAIETRTGDTPADRRRRQRERPPQMLLTTPESLAVMLSLPDAAALFAAPARGGDRRGARARRHQARRPTGARPRPARDPRPRRAPHRAVGDRGAPRRARGLCLGRRRGGGVRGSRSRTARRRRSR